MFREYDLRGLVSDDELNEQSVEIISRAYGTMLRKRDITDAVLGYDFRESSERFRDAFIRGLTATGVNVVDLGMILTPMVYSAQYHYQIRGGVMITGDHYPNHCNGFKLSLDYSHPFAPKEMKELYDLTVSGEVAEGNGMLRKESFFDAYKADLLKRINLAKPLKVVVNAGNGTAGPIAPAILRAAGCEVIELCTNPDWSFPEYFPDPSRPAMMEDTGRKVVEAGADIGLALDGDGDRLGVTDEKGNVIFPDQFLILLARQVLETNPGAKIIFDARSTQALPNDVEAHGGIPFMCATGYSHLKDKLRKEKAILGGGKSGHIFFGEPVYYGFEDGVFSALKLLDYLSRQNQTFSQIMSTIPQYVATPTLHVECPDEVKYQIVGKLTQEFKEGGHKVDATDGARVSFPGGWALVRASSSLPALTLDFGAKTQEDLEKIQKILQKKLAAIAPQG